MKQLSQRICIIGPAGSGKSTLAFRLGKYFDFPVVHLDKLHHEPSGNWVARPKEDFLKDHDEAITKDKWVIDGNYTKSMPQRFERADTIIIIEINRFVSLYRHTMRYLKQKYGIEKRYGQPDNINDRYNMSMIWWILQPKILDKKRRNKMKIRNALLDQHKEKIINIRSFKQMEQFMLPR